MKGEIAKTKIQNRRCGNIKKSTLQLYGFVYFRLIDFWYSNFEIKTMTTNDFFESVYNISNCEFHLNHSHMTEKNRGYVHNFCNWRLRETKLEMSCFAHNMFGFYLYFILRGIRLSTWETKNLSIGGTNLININFANLSNKLKFINTCKYFQTILVALASTIDKNEENNIKSLLKQFI